MRKNAQGTSDTKLWNFGQILSSAAADPGRNKVIPNRAVIQIGALRQRATAKSSKAAANKYLAKNLGSAQSGKQTKPTGVLAHRHCNQQRR